MLESEYLKPRVLPRHLRPPVTPEPAFEYTIRDAVFSDLPDVREIFNHYVKNSAVTFDDRALTHAAWRERFAYLTKLKMPFLVAASPSGQVLGYALLSPWKQQRAYRFTVENSIYLRAAATGKGLGRALLTQLIERAEEAGIKEILAVISDVGAEASVRLHEDLGFVEVGRMGKVGFKFDRWLGTITLRKVVKKPKKSSRV